MKMRWMLVALAAGLVLAGCQRDGGAPGDAGEELAAPATVPQDAAGGDAGAADPERPELRIETLDGAMYDLADHRGKWVVVNFWATWCAPCREEMPELSALGVMREHVEVVGLAYEEVEPEAMRAFLEEFPVAYPIAIVDVYDPPAGFDTPRGLPMTYLLAPDGTVARKFLGPVTARELEEAIAEAGGPEVPGEPAGPAAPGEAGA